MPTMFEKSDINICALNLTKSQRVHKVHLEEERNNNGSKLRPSLIMDLEQI
jgi:hypothetical protein